MPRALVGRETEHGKAPPRIRPVFHDQGEISASADLGRALRTALRSARTLIVICSPQSARSRWVGEEIRHFKQLGRSNRIYCLNADGEPVDAGKEDNDRVSFHPALMENFDGDGRRLEGTGSEPLAVDLGDDGLFIAGTKLAAGVLGVGYDDLYQRVRRQKFRNRSLLGTVIALIVSTGVWLYADGLREKQLNRAQQLATQARQEVYAAQPLAGLALALHAVAVAPQRGEAENATILATARDLATRGRIARMGNDVQDIVPNADGTRLAVDHRDANGELRSGTDGALIQELSERIFSAKFLENAPGYLIADHRGSAQLRLAGNGAHVAELKSPVRNVTFGPGYFFAQNGGGYSNELRRIDDGLVVSSLGMQVTKVGYPSARSVQVHLQDGSEELRRLSDDRVIKAALLRNIASDTIVGPGSE